MSAPFAANNDTTEQAITHANILIIALVVIVAEYVRGARGGCEAGPANFGLPRRGDHMIKILTKETLHPATVHAAPALFC